MKTILAAPDPLKIEKISFCSDEIRLVVKTRLPKRQMFGRANLDLLKTRVLKAV
jgi:hypothetical protein